LIYMTRLWHFSSVSCCVWEKYTSLRHRRAFTRARSFSCVMLWVHVAFRCAYMCFWLFLVLLVPSLSSGHASALRVPAAFSLSSPCARYAPAASFCNTFVPRRGRTTAHVLPVYCPFPRLAQGEGLLMCPTSISFTLRALSAPFFFVQTCPTLFGVVHTFLLWNYTSLLPRMYRSSLPSFAAANARCCNMAQDLSSCHDDCPDFFLILIEARPIWKPPSPSEVTLQ
jgi:hypothetical protein